MSVTLITGPVRSGKSRFAERLAHETKALVTYVATAACDPQDLEWKARIAHHQRRRPAHWELVETGCEPRRELADVFDRADGHHVVLVDSLGTWLADRMTSAHSGLFDDALALESALEADCAKLTGAIQRSTAPAFLVGEEVGWGIVPLYASARVFRDVLGRLQQTIAARAASVYLVVSGIAIDLRAIGVPNVTPDVR